MDKCLELDMRLVNLFPEPLPTTKIMNAAKKVGFEFDEPADAMKRGATYHVRTKHGQKLGTDAEGYIYSSGACAKKLEAYLGFERIAASLGVSTIGWNFTNQDENEDMLAFLKEQGIQNIEIAPTSIWGSWDGVREAVADGRVAEFAKDMEQKGFTITSMQAILYQLTYQLFSDTDDFYRHFELIVDLADQLSLGKRDIKIVFGAPKNRNPEINDEKAMEIAVEMFTKIGDLCKGRHAIVCMEANPPAYGCEFLNTLQSCKEFAKVVGHQCIQFMVDTGCASLGGDALNFTKADVNDLAHVHLSQPYLGPFASDDSFLETLRVMREVLLKKNNWIIETRNTGNVDDFKNTVVAVKKNLMEFMGSL